MNYQYQWNNKENINKSELFIPSLNLSTNANLFDNT